MALQCDQKQRVWLDLTEYKTQDWKSPAFNEQSTAMVPEKLFFGALRTPSMTEKTLPGIPQRPTMAVRFDQGRSINEKTLQNVPQRSYTNARVEPPSPVYSAVRVPTTPKPMAKTLPNPEARMTKSTTALREQGKSTLKGSLKHTGSIRSRRRKDSDEISSRSGRSSPRAEHVTAIKKRDLTADVTSQKSKFHPGSIGEQCRRFLHDSLNLPAFHSSRTTNGVDFECQSAKAENERHKSFEKKTAFRQSPSAPHDETNSLAYEHINTSPNLRAPPTPTRPIISNNKDHQNDSTGMIVHGPSSTKAKSKAAAIPPRTSSTKPSGSGLVITIDFKPTCPHIPSMKLSSPSGLLGTEAAKSTLLDTQLPDPNPSPKVQTTDDFTILDADRVLIEVLRRIGARMESKTKDERMPVLKVTESLTREVLNICKGLTAGKPIHFI